MAKAAHTPKVQPRMLGFPDAAGYCGVSVPTFKAHCPVQPVRLGTRILFDIRALDRWLDALSAPCSAGAGKDWIGRLENAGAH